MFVFVCVCVWVVLGVCVGGFVLIQVVKEFLRFNPLRYQLKFYVQLANVNVIVVGCGWLYCCCWRVVPFEGPKMNNMWQ